MNEIEIDELPAEQQAEARAAFGEGSKVLQLEPDDLEKVETPEYPIRHILEEGDWITVGHMKGQTNVTVGPVEAVNRVGFQIDPRNRTTSGYFGYGDLERNKDDELGVLNKIIDINGEPAEQVIERRKENQKDLRE